jgi:hypothetical protein
MVDNRFNSHYENISLKLNNLLVRLLIALNSRDKDVSINSIDSNSQPKENIKIEDNINNNI